MMTQVKAVMLALAASFVHNVSVEAKGATVGDRIEQVKESVDSRWTSLKKRFTAFLAYFGDESKDAQERRLAFYQWLDEKELWERHPKKWIVWIMTGNMPVKNPDARINDAQYVEYFIAFKELEKGTTLTDVEVLEARDQAMDMLDKYRRAKGLA